MSAIWNTTAIEVMNEEQRVRNFCRQLRQEAAEWNRNLGYAGGMVRCWQDLPQGVTVLIGGKGKRAFAIVDKNGAQSRRFKVCSEAAELYAEIMN